MNPNLKYFFLGGGRGGRGEWGGEGEVAGGARVSNFFSQRIQI